MPLAEIARGLERFVAAFGRFERIAIGDRRLLMLLIKNPAGANEAVRTLLDGDAPRLAVVALNDEIADGRDVSWIWDVDFEPLLGGLDRVVATGSRAAELALRFAYGGLERDRIEVVPDLERALDRGLELTPAGGELVVLPTYTAMLALRRIVAGARPRGAVLGARRVRIRVGHLYPDRLNIYADRGNIAVLTARAAARGHELEVTPVGLGDARAARPTCSTSAAARTASRRSSRRTSSRKGLRCTRPSTRARRSSRCAAATSCSAASTATAPAPSCPGSACCRCTRSPASDA